MNTTSSICFDSPLVWAGLALATLLSSCVQHIALQTAPAPRTSMQYYNRPGAGHWTETDTLSKSYQDACGTHFALCRFFMCFLFFCFFFLFVVVFNFSNASRTVSLDFKDDDNRVKDNRQLFECVCECACVFACVCGYVCAYVCMH